MISPVESLAFSMHANPGVYAVLAGSGLSRAARIPTGWEITLELVRKLAAVRGKRCDPDPEQWHRKTFGKEPNYSDLLDAVCRTPAERQQLLQSYVEPSEEEREEGAKQPTTAHRAIAALAAQGFIRVIVTTNFDRLFETALEAETVRPVVVSSPDQVRGALPLLHTSCYVVKLLGDYLDFELHLQQVIGRDLGEAVSASFLTVNFHELDGQDICQVTVEPSDHPIYVEHQNEALFYLRVGNGTRALPVDEVVRYVHSHWGRTA